MKYLTIIAMVWLTTTFTNANAQAASEYNFEYTITFESTTFEGDDIRMVVREFRNHIFADTHQKFNFKTRFDESGSMHIKTDYPLQENQVITFFEARDKEYITFKNSKKEKSRSHYAFRADF
ncbi:MAG: hypothetical protein ACQERC_02225 [Bacteroidota bacterium]